MAEPEQVAKYLSEPYSRVLVPDPSGGYFAEILEFPGCFSQGDTPQEAIKNLEEAMAAWTDAALDAGQSIPAPAASRGYSGHVALRMPKSLHREAVRRAELDGVSLNQYLVAAIEARVAGETLADQIVARVGGHFVMRVTTQVDFAVNVAGAATGEILKPVGELVEADTGEYSVIDNLARREHQNA